MTKLDERGVEAACEAAAITIARQDGVELTPAGFRHGAASRPDDHAQMREYMSAAIIASLRAEIARLTAERAKAREDALEEAAQVVDAERAECRTKAREHEASGELDLMRLWMGYGGTCAILSQSIRTLKEKQP